MNPRNLFIICFILIFIYTVYVSHYAFLILRIDRRVPRSQMFRRSTEKRTAAIAGGIVSTSRLRTTAQQQSEVMVRPTQRPQRARLRAAPSHPCRTRATMSWTRLVFGPHFQRKQKTSLSRRTFISPALASTHSIISSTKRTKRTLENAQSGARTRNR